MERVSIIPVIDGTKETERQRTYAIRRNERLHPEDIVSGHAFATSVPPLRLLYLFSLKLAHCWWWCLDTLIALFITTTENSEEYSGIPRNVEKALTVFKGLLLLLALLLWTPFAVVSFTIWFPLQLFRPRAYSFYSSADASSERQRLLFSNVSSPYRNISDPKENTASIKEATTSFSKKFYTVVSGNVCLMPEFLAKLNNVSNSVKRAKKISQLVCGNQPPSESKRQSYASQFVKGSKALDAEVLVSAVSEGSVNNTSIGSKFENESFCDEEVISLDSSVETQSLSSMQWSVTSKEKAVCETFSKSTDFLCLQETFDKRACDALFKGLRAKYPYIIYDVAWPLHHRRISLLNSGLCIASKYPFLNIRFEAYPDGYREDKLACKGLLMAEVFLGETEDGRKRVGYLATTHLQAITHAKASEVRCKQLNLLLQWLGEFRESTAQQNDVVMFDIICGDFNFDQESYFEEGERKCQFRRVYHDPCMNEATGQQHSWVVGTELISQLLHDSAVNTSQGLQRMLVSELERPRYVASTAPANRTMTRMSDGRRRIDYILYKPCGTKKMVVKDYKFVTGFASLTDHIPLSMTFTVEN